MSSYLAAPARYDAMKFNRSGRSGLKLPAVSLGLWHNFGGVDHLENARAMCRTAFDLGVTHFDLANNYGPPPGSAEENFGQILAKDFRGYRDELVISSKAGYGMWPGPYGDFGSRKYLISSLDQSLKRMNLDYVDIFYHHRPDNDTPLEETMSALAHTVTSGKALYVGISSYPADKAALAAQMLREMGAPCLIHQPAYSIFNRWIEGDLLATLEAEGVGCIAFSPLAQGMLTDKYLKGIEPGSRASKPSGFLKPEHITDEMLDKVRQLNHLATERGQTLAQMSLAWVLRHSAMTSVLIGASRPQQIVDCVGCLENLDFSAEELARIDAIAPA
ncbi:MAG TPA: L-glyceraldehyde 3-phosphate reductase [Abditibacteriaceae bacterium]|jgi:L-glyceraldehyde 3-phosphate reductase